MGKAKLISAADARDEFTTFTGVTRLRQGQLPSGAPLEVGSFSARAAEAATGLSRSATTAARIENSENALPPASDVARSKTLSAPTNGPAVGAGMTRGLSLRYQKTGGDGPGGDGGGAAGLTRQMTQLNVRDRNEPPPPLAPAPAPSSAPQLPRIESGITSSNGKAGAGTRLTEIYDDYLGEEDPSSVPLPPGAVDRVAQWANRTVPGAPAPPSGASSMAGASPPPPGRNNISNNERLRQNVGLSRNNTSRGPGSVAGSMRRKPSRRPNNSSAPSSYGGRSVRDRSTVYDDDDEEGYVSGEYDDVEYGLTKLKIKVRHAVQGS